jgi:hypothetical protein
MMWEASMTHGMLGLLKKLGEVDSLHVKRNIFSGLLNLVIIDD